MLLEETGVTVMYKREQLAKEHADVTRRYFLELGAAGAVALSTSRLWAQGQDDNSQRLLREAVSKLEYLTRDENFINFGRGTPPPHELPPEKLREVGLTRETWQLEVLADPEVELVDLCTPTPLHPEQSIAALKAGKYVFCEKPLARTSAAAREILKVAESSRGFLMPAMCMRFWPGWSWKWHPPFTRLISSAPPNGRRQRGWRWARRRSNLPRTKSS